ncbi:hypothetical protein ACSBM8_17955 [Sphingomonas sp. ASY06-1R]|jgi:hypothetical protein|uniref:hypothetical protein n=1 Tax=Sphingomonas sp. ASY06-1R TaxID=3445771 RepID=UPI003FA34087
MATNRHTFLHMLDPAARRGTYVQTTAAALRATPFLDGRTPYWEGAPAQAALPLRSPSPLAAPRMLFHVGFCGSTLLGTLLDRPGKTLVLREPQALTDLAAYRSALDRDAYRDPGFSDVLAGLLSALYRPWAAGEAIVVKPSNWVNALLPDLVAAPVRVRPLFQTMQRRAFVRAIVRGGPARMAFAARACVHLSNADTGFAQRLATLLARPEEPDDRLLMLAALLHDIQLALFRAAADAGGWGGDHWVSLEAFRADPAATLAIAARALDIEPPSRDMLADHAKHPGTTYSADAEATANAAVDAAHGVRIDHAIACVDETA